MRRLYVQIYVAFLGIVAPHGSCYAAASTYKPLTPLSGSSSASDLVCVSGNS